ncbi:hypothetical protein [Robertmurraya massiliosenegalensis]|uniref:hypothetical protein n=1 Tax=Robertmurraya massiliosenegalensis TaxID=1287657 RepID=UPI0002E1B492|nr:hypothetical protein [Robertmurraya massiliosenegalensis]
MKKSELLKQGNYLTVIKPLAHKIGLEETIILMELVGMEEYKEQKHLMFKELMSNENKKINQNKVSFYESDRAFECTATELELATTIKRKKQIVLLAKMMDMKLLITEQRGLPARRFILLNHENIEKLLEESLASYQDFKDQFFAEKKEIIQKQMEKRKQNKYTQSLLSQNDTTDNTNSSDNKKEENAQSNQLSQNDTTSYPESGQQVESNEDSLNNTSSLRISSPNNIEDLSIYENKIIELGFPLPIQVIFMKKIDRLISDQINLNELFNIWETEKHSENGLNEYEFANMLDNALSYAKSNIGNTNNFFSTALINYKKKRVVDSSLSKVHKPIRVEKIPLYMEEENENVAAPTIQELEEKLEKLYSLLTRERFKENKDLTVEISKTEEALKKMKSDKEEIDELLKQFRKSV